MATVSYTPAGVRAVVHAKGDLRWDPIPPTEMTARHRVVRTEYSLVSPGTELAFYTGTHACLSDPNYAWANYPVALGYAAVGQIEPFPGLGTDDEFPAGTRVFCMPRHATRSVQHLDHDAIAAVPAGLDPRLVPFARMAQITFTALLQTFVPPARVEVIGAGIVGILVAQQYATLRAATVTLYDVDPARLELARRCGLADCRLIPAGDPVPAAETPPDVVVDATGVQALIPQLIKRPRPGGQLILLGSPRGPVEVDVYRFVHLRSISLTGAHESLLPTRAPAGERSRAGVAAEMLAHIAAGRLIVEPLISHEIAPAQLAEAYEGLLTRKSEYTGVLVRW